MVAVAVAAEQGQGTAALLGTWQGELVINPATHLTVQFIVSRNNEGKASAVLNAPEEANLQNIAVNSFSLSGDKVVFVVDEVSGRYEGTLSNGRISGKWQQNGASFDLGLAPHVRVPIPAKTATYLEGPWSGVLHIPESDRKLPLVINFKIDSHAASGMDANVDSPDQAAYGIPAEDVELEDGVLTVKILRPKMSFSGHIEGNQLVGQWTQGGSAPLVFTKGKYQVPGLELAKSARVALNGDWYGVFSNGIGIALKFRDDPTGKLLATLDSPYEGRRGIPVTAIDVAGDRIAMRVDGVGASFKGTLAKDAIAGKFSADGQERQVIFRHGDYVPEVLHLAPEIAGRLVGRWEGRTANTNLILRFQLDQRGDLIALEDIPNRQLFSLPISDLVLKGDDLSLTVKGIAAEFRGKVAKNEISGDWKMPTLQFPLRLTRGEVLGK
jgi:hypothetical protein